MIFQKLIVENFRQFYGRQEISFATNTDTNVTVIHGFNGSGKTTFLNIFTWLFYNEFSPDFENSDYLDNESAFSKIEAGKSFFVSAKLTFNDRRRIYTAQRKRLVGKDETGRRYVDKTNFLTVTYTSETGEIMTVGNPQDTLEQLLPKSLYPFFFFNGERIEKLANPEAYTQIESGVKVLLDIEVFDRAIFHLGGDIFKKLRDEIAENAGTEGKRVRQELESIEDQKNELIKEIDQLRHNLSSLEQEKNKIDAKLFEIPELAQWQTERKEKEEKLKNICNQLKENRSLLGREVSRHGYLAFVPDVLQKAKETLDTAHQKGELPIPMKRQFVSELIEKGCCICGRELIPGEHSYQCVKDWRERIGSEDLEGAVSVTNAKLKSLFSRRERLSHEINELQKKRDILLQDRRFVEEALSELSSKIGNREHGEEHQKLENRRRKIDKELLEFNVDIKQKEIQIQEFESQINEKKQFIQKLDKVDAKGKLAQRRLEAVTNVKSAIEKIRKIRHQQLSRELSRHLSEVWGRIAIKDYHAQMDEQYHLILTKRVGDAEEPVRGASTGEKQVLSLAFIGSLVDKARATYDDQPDKKILFKGGLYPLMIDSAFGQLEPEYKRDVAKWIPTLAPQVIILVSESQWKHEVEEELQSRIGAEWILQCITPKQRTKTITLRGREYPYVVESSDGLEQTEIIEVDP